MTLFEHLNNICLSKKYLDIKNPEERKNYEPYMINRFISMSEIFIPFANEINMFSEIPKEINQRYWINLMPRRKQYFNYIKKGKELNQKEKEYICEYYQCSLNEAEKMINILTKEQLTKIIEIYDPKN